VEVRDCKSDMNVLSFNFLNSVKCPIMIYLSFLYVKEPVVESCNVLMRRLKQFILF